METITKNIPALALRGLTVFPRMTASFDVEREISVRALERAMETGQEIFLVTQRELGVELPEEKDLYEVGTVARVIQILRASNSMMRVVMEGGSRARLRRLWQREPFLQAQVELIGEEKSPRHGTRTEAMLRQTYALFGEYSELLPKQPESIFTTVMDATDPGFLADFIAQNSNLRYQDKQSVLEELRPLMRLRRVNEILKREISVIAMEQDIESKVRERVGQIQKDMILREQVKVLQNELGEGDSDAEFDEYRTRICACRLPEETEKKLLKDVDRLSRQPFGSAEASVLRNYLDTVLDMPWGVETNERVSVETARRRLDRDHYGMEKVKERILEFIAVRRLNPDARGQIICLVGPPGVGKTSIARSIAEATGRKYVRVSLGGVRDEADIMGHRRTYVGSMPGRIMAAVKQAGTNNPLILLDEIDKLGQSFKGDPSASLLEVLDPEQNSAFQDHYIDLPFDLSHVLFVTTANDASAIPGPLYDRMDVITLGSYTAEEKFHIASKYLVPKQLKKHGIKAAQLRFTPKALHAIIEDYTREAGVRTLERTIGTICRKVARRIVTEEDFKSYSVKPADLEDLLGPAKFAKDKEERRDEIGLVNGLAWTSVGGELLPIEVAVMNGTGKIQLTGSLGDVMKESATTAITCIRTRAETLGISPDFYAKKDIHIHAPEGAVPKDGPSAGIAMATAVTSALCEEPIAHDIAMTGEITLQGRVLPIGGLREKSMAAYKNGMKTVIIPHGNIADLAEVDQVVKDNVRFVPVRRIDEVLPIAMPGLLNRETKPNTPCPEPAHGVQTLRQ